MELERLYIEQKMMMEEIADEYDTTGKTIGQALDTYGIEKREGSEERHRGLLRKSPGIEVKPGGYVIAKNKHMGEVHRVYLHRLLAVCKYGYDEVCENEVHHKNKIPWDNRPDNIELMDKAEHGRIHALERWNGRA